MQICDTTQNLELPFSQNNTIRAKVKGHKTSVTFEALPEKNELSHVLNRTVQNLRNI